MKRLKGVAQRPSRNFDSDRNWQLRCGNRGTVAAERYAFTQDGEKLGKKVMECGVLDETLNRWSENISQGSHRI